MIIILGVFLLAGIVKGVIGLGLPTLAMGLLSTTMEPAIAASLLIIPSLVTNLWQLFIGPNFIALIKRLWGFIVGIFIGTLWSFLPSLSASSTWTIPALGAILIAYGCLGITTKKLSHPAHLEKWLSPFIGYFTGTISAATGVFVIPAVPYLQSLKLNKDELVQALGLAFTASTIALALQLSQDNSFDSIDYYLSIIALIPAMIGMYIGQYCRKIMSEAIFKRCFFIGLIALGGYMSFK